MLQAREDIVCWHSVFELLGRDDEPLLTGMQNRSTRPAGAGHLMDTEWRGGGQTDGSIGENGCRTLFLQKCWTLRPFCEQAKPRYRSYSL